MSLSIRAKNVSKQYGATKALSSLSLDVQPGSTFALLGPNGAGKTTFVKSLLGLVRLDSGEIEINGESSKSANSRAKLAYLPEKFQFFSFDTPANVLRFYAKARGVSAQTLSSQVNDALEKTLMIENANKKLKNLSKGQMQRVGLASLLVGKPDLLILDEPFSGLDPVGIKELRDILKKLKEEGKTIFINSHILSEMEKICDSFAVLNKGECLAQGQSKELLASQSLENFFYGLIKPESKE